MGWDYLASKTFFGPPPTKKFLDIKQKNSLKFFWSRNFIVVWFSLQKKISWTSNCLVLGCNKGVYTSILELFDSLICAWGRVYSPATFLEGPICIDRIVSFNVTIGSYLLSANLDNQSSFFKGNSSFGRKQDRVSLPLLTPPPLKTHSFANPLLYMVLWNR